MYISASAPDAPPLSDTTIGCFIRLFFWIAACIIRAIWSEAPPAPAATTISTGLVGSQAAKAGALIVRAASTTVVFIQFRICFVPVTFLEARPAADLIATLRLIPWQFKQIAAIPLMTFGWGLSRINPAPSAIFRCLDEAQGRGSNSS